MSPDPAEHSHCLALNGSLVSGFPSAAWIWRLIAIARSASQLTAGTTATTYIVVPWIANRAYGLILAYAGSTSPGPL